MMLTPHTSPSFPSGPHNTPASVFQSHKPHRPPILNPYDKFTQPEFDSWINDITGALRRALGREPVFSVSPNAAPKTFPEQLGSHRHAVQDIENLSDVGSEDSQDFEDSFANVKARLAKGKARDPREGPGLGSQHQPIDVESESEGEEDGDNQILTLDEGEQEEKEEWEAEEGSVQGEDAGSLDYDVPTFGMPKMNGYDNGEAEVIELISDEEEEDRVADEGPHDDDADNAYEQDEDQETDFPSFNQDSFSPPPEVPDAWEGPRTYAEDYYSGGDLPESDLRFDRYSPSNLTPLREKRVETLRTALLDGLAHPRTSPLREDWTADTASPETMDMDVKQSRPYDVEKDGVDVSSENHTADEQAPIVVEDVEAATEADPVDMEDGTINAAGTFNIEGQEVVEGGESGHVDSEALKSSSVEPLSIELSATPSPSDFGVLPDTSLDSGSALMGGQLDMSEVLSFLSYDGDEGPQEVRNLGGNDRDSIDERINAQPETTAALNNVIGSAEEISPAVADKIIGGDASIDGPFAESAKPPQEASVGVIADSYLPASNLPSSGLPSETTSATAEPPITLLKDITSAEPTPDDELMTSNAPRTPEVSPSTDLPYMTSPSREIRNGFPMPISADPNVPDPTIQTSSLTSPVRTPMVLSLPGTPAILLSPVTTPGIPIPVSVPVRTSVLRAMQMQQALSANSASGLFTPADGSESAPGTPDGQPDNREAPSAKEGVSIHIAAEDATSVPLVTPAEPVVEGEEGAGDSISVIDSKPTTDEEPKIPDDSAAVEASDQQEDAGDDRGQMVTPSSLREVAQTEEPSPIRVGISASPSIPISPGVPIICRAEPKTPTLQADPYPYSLSTPGTVFLDQDSRNDDAESPSERENDVVSRSSSSYTAKNEIETRCEDADRVVDASDYESDFELLYPSEGSEEEDVFTVPIQEVADVNDENGTALPDEPQEQVIDPNTDTSVSSQIQSVQSGDDSDMVTSPTASEEGLETEDQDLAAKSSPVQEVTPPDCSKADDDDGVKVRITRSMEDDNLASPRPFKRQRLSPPSPNSRSVPQEFSGPAEAISKTTTKGKEKGGWDVNESTTDSESTSSGASTALRMLYPGSGTTSRASSVVSNVPSVSSFASRPTSSSASRPPENANNNLSHLFHTHGVARQHHQIQSPTKQLDRTNQLTTPRTKHPQTNLINRSEPGLPQRSAPSSSSPITRSNCRFHKISLPLKEGGPRVYFLVPGCSLSDIKLMDVQDIQDHGYATEEEGGRSTSDLDSLDFNSYFEGLLRQLVGVDLLREQEVYYLPQPGEDHGRKGRPKTAATRLSLRDPPVHATPPVTPLVKRKSRRSLTPPTRDTPNSKVSTAPLTRHGVEPVPDSSSVASSSDMRSEDGDITSPSQRMARLNKDSIDSSLLPLSIIQTQAPPSSARRGKGRRSKRLDIDALAYKPSADAEGSSGDEQAHGRRSKLKRTRTSEALHDGSDRKRKHKRLRSMSPAVVEQS